MMRWLRKLLLPPLEDETDVDAARYRLREQASRWDRVHHSIAEAEATIRGERRTRNIGHTPERRHG